MFYISHRHQELIDKHNIGFKTLPATGHTRADPLFGVLPIGCGGSMFVFVLLCITLCPFQFCNHLEEEERELVALLLLSYRCLVTVNVM